MDFYFYKVFNLILQSASEKDQKIYHEIVKVYQSDKTKQLYHKYYGNKQIAAWDVKLK